MDGPRPHFLLACREVALQAQEVIGRVGEPVEPGLGEPQCMEEVAAIVGGELRELGLHLGRKDDDLRRLLVLGEGGAERIHVGVAAHDVGLGHVRGIQDGLGREQVEGTPDRALLLGGDDGARRASRGQHVANRFQHALLELCLRISRLRGPRCPVQPPLDRGEIGQPELDVDHFAVAYGVGRSHDVLNVGVVERPDHVDDCIHLADVGQKLVAEPLAPARPLHEARDVQELHGRRDRPLG